MGCGRVGPIRVPFAPRPFGKVPFGVCVTPPGRGTRREARGIAVTERTIMPDELGDFDEVFLTGTAAEVTPIAEIGPHHYQVGPITRTLMDDYVAEVRGE